MPNAQHLKYAQNALRPLPVARLAAAAFMLLALCGPARAEPIYAFVDDEGITHFSNVPDTPNYRLVWGEPEQAAPEQPVGGRPYASLIASEARESHLDPMLVHAVIAIESAYDPRARSRKGAIGLMQLMPETARRYGATDPWPAEINVRAGTRYLSDLLSGFGGDVELALAAYNAGEAAVIRYGRRIPPFAETRAYVPRVLRKYAELRAQSGVAISPTARRKRG
jgi:soluble lytic murein transglycosylase-like protein